MESRGYSRQRKLYVQKQENMNVETCTPVSMLGMKGKD